MTSPTLPIETERLRLRRFEKGDLDAVISALVEADRVDKIAGSDGQ